MAALVVGILGSAEWTHWLYVRADQGWQLGLVHGRPGSVNSNLKHWLFWCSLWVAPKQNPLVWVFIRVNSCWGIFILKTIMMSLF